MKQVPFVPNSPDNIHCVNAVFRMIHQYFFKKDLTWEQIDTLTKAVPGKATWTFVGEMEFAKKGLEIINIEPVDYQKLYKEGLTYLSTVVGEKNAEYYFKKTNIEYVITYIPEYLRSIQHETRKATIQDIVDHLQQGSLIAAEIDLGILNQKKTFEPHMVLIYDFDGSYLWIHDPGLPPNEGRKVSTREFEECFAYPGSNQGISVFTSKR